MSRKVSSYSEKRKLCSAIAYTICKYSDKLDFSCIAKENTLDLRYLLKNILSLKDIYSQERVALLDKIINNKENLND